MRKSKQMIASALMAAMLLGGVQSVSAAPVYSELAEVADALYGVTATPSTIHVGDQVALEIVTGRSTTHVQVLGADGSVVAQASDGAVDKSGRLYWTLSFPIGQVGEQTYRVVAGNRYVDSASREITVSVLSNVPKPVVTGVTIKNTSAYCTVENYPDLSKVRLEVRDSAGNVVYADYQDEKLEAGTYTFTSGHQEWWNMTRPMEISLEHDGETETLADITVSRDNLTEIVSSDVTIEEDQTVTYSVTSTGDQAPVISWLGVAETEEKDPDEPSGPALSGEALEDSGSVSPASAFTARYGGVSFSDDGASL